MQEKKFVSLLGLMGILFVLGLLLPESFWHTAGYEAEEAALTIPTEKMKIEPNELGEVLVVCTPMPDENDEEEEEPQNVPSSESSQSTNSTELNPMVPDTTYRDSRPPFQSVSWTTEKHALVPNDELPTEPGVNGRTLFKPRTHQIVDGDSLESLARRYLYDPERAMDIYESNRDKLDSPNMLPIGMVLTIPDPEW